MNKKIKQLNVFTLAEGGHSKVGRLYQADNSYLCGDEGVAEGYS